MPETTKQEARFNGAMFNRPGEAPHDLIVTITMQSKVTGESVSMSFPKARYLDGVVETTMEQEVLSDYPYSYKTWTVPTNQKIELKLELVALPDDEERCIYQLTRSQ